MLCITAKSGEPSFSYAGRGRAELNLHLVTPLGAGCHLSALPVLLSLFLLLLRRNLAASLDSQPADSPIRFFSYPPFCVSQRAMSTGAR
jgi:hypothetical protein